MIAFSRASLVSPLPLRSKHEWKHWAFRLLILAALAAFLLFSMLVPFFFWEAFLHS